jgi:hypothetical protein
MCNLCFVCWFDRNFKLAINLCASWGRWSTPRPGRFTQYPFQSRLGGPQGHSEWLQKISPPSEFESQTFQTVAIRWYSDLLQAGTQIRAGRSGYPGQQYAWQRIMYCYGQRYVALLPQRQPSYLDLLCE